MDILPRVLVWHDSDRAEYKQRPYQLEANVSPNVIWESDLLRQLQRVDVLRDAGSYSGVISHDSVGFECYTLAAVEFEEPLDPV